MKRNIAIVTAMTVLLSGLSISVQAAQTGAIPTKTKAHVMHKHQHVTHKTTGTAAKQG